MKTIEELKEEIKNELAFCTYQNDGSIYAQVNENIRWAWENWNIDFTGYYDGDEKPETYTPEFRDQWIDNEPFDQELEQINNL